MGCNNNKLNYYARCCNPIPGRPRTLKNPNKSCISSSTVLHNKPTHSFFRDKETKRSEAKRQIRKAMRPILMKGHERPLTFLKYNRDGDLLFSCAKDHNPTVWFADNGAVWCCDVSSKSLSQSTN